MSKQSKMIYFFMCFIFFVLFNGYFTEFILANNESMPQNKFLDIVFIQNPGAAFNILQGSKLFLIVFSAIALLVIVFYTYKHITKTSVFALFFTSMLCSGIFSNMCERMIWGYVRDYIKLNFIDFPVFNISDIFINLGVFAIVIVIIKNNYTKNNENNN